MKIIELLQQQLIIDQHKKLHHVLFNLKGHYLLLLGDLQQLSCLPDNYLHTVSIAPHNYHNHTPHIQAPYENLPLRNASIDYALLPYTLESCADPMAVFNELHRSLLPEGKLFLLAYQHWHPLSWINTFHSKRFLSVHHIKNFLYATNFNIITTQWVYYGAAVLIEAQKKVIGLTPLKPVWKKNVILDKHFQPSTRNLLRENQHD